MNKEDFMHVEERFLKYVSYWTTSDEDNVVNGAARIPSTNRQFELGKLLEKELNDLGLSKVTLTDHCYVYGLLPATSGYEGKKAVGFISHMDTAPDFSGENVRPQIISDYDGNDVLLNGNGSYLKVSDFPSLAELKGRTLITTDGTTLLGADDKAGIAEIITAVEEITQSGQPHGDIWIGFTPDEEVGCGADLFDLNYFKADFAYTVDGDYEGEVAYENFNAASAVFSIKGVNVHPGEAKDIMVNAALVACEIQAALPQDETPAHTAGRQGFFHLTDIEGDVASAKLSYIVRDHEKTAFETKLNLLRTLEIEINQKYGAGTVTLTITDSYSNMLEIIEQHPYVVDIAKKAISNIGLEPLSRPVRGGTDGARLSFMGLPCPNLGTGGYGFHGPYEHISIEGMKTVVRIIREIASITAEL
jgi:tripeptide aminopeptidase